MCRSSPRRARAATAAGARGRRRRSRLALRRLRREFPYDLVHAHYAAPGGDAVRRARPGAPYVVSVHGGDVLSVARRARRRACRSERRSPAPGSCSPTRPRSSSAPARSAPRATRVVHLGTDLPQERPTADGAALVTVANLVARKRHADVLRALWLLRDSHPALAWIVVGDGPERPALERLAGELGLSGRLHFTGRLPHAEAVATAPPRRGVRAAERRRGVRRGLRRGDGRRACRRSARAASPGRRRSRRRAAGSGSSRPATRRRSRRSCARCSTTRAGGSSSAARRARRSRRRSRGRAAARRPSPPTRRRCG